MDEHGEKVGFVAFGTPRDWIVRFPGDSAIDTIGKLHAEIDRLRAKLAHAEAALKEVRNEINAIVEEIGDGAIGPVGVARKTLCNRLAGVRALADGERGDT